MPRFNLLLIILYGQYVTQRDSADYIQSLIPAWHKNCFNFLINHK